MTATGTFFDDGGYSDNGPRSEYTRALHDGAARCSDHLVIIIRVDLRSIGATILPESVP